MFMLKQCTHASILYIQITSNAQVSVVGMEPYTNFTVSIQACTVWKCATVTRTRLTSPMAGQLHIAQTETLNMYFSHASRVCAVE